MNKTTLPTKTVLYLSHRALNAKMEQFGGYNMPIQYDSIIKEHNTTRNDVSLFDTCHMGEFRISGDNACEDLENILSCRISTMKIGQCRYGFICNKNGGVIDDQIIYRIAKNKFFMVVNASTQENDFAWISKHLSYKTSITNISEITAKIDVQGPKSPMVINQLLEDSIEDLKFYYFKYTYYKNTKVLVSRTGYTGEIGFEIYCPHDIATKIWNTCIKLGAKPAGLGCRDTLRLEMGFPLYGQELDEKRNAYESGLTYSIANDKKYIGSNVLLDPEMRNDKLVAIILEGRRAARHGDTILSQDNKVIGSLTSGSFSPSLKRGIAMGYVKKEFSQIDTNLIIDTKRHKINAKITDLPFYKNATGREPVAKFI